jgi:type I site-specific restriction endonuclease
MDKKNLSESDICDKFIRPAMVAAGWNGVFAPYTGIKTKPIRIEEFDAEKAWWGTEADELLADYARMQAEAQGLRDQVKLILAQSLGAQT